VIVNNKLKDITVVIRSSGEKTLNWCEELLKQQISSDQIFVIKETPFWKAVAKSFNIAIKENRKWLLAIDADVLFFPDSLARILGALNNLPQEVVENSFVIQGLLYCNYHNDYRGVGAHLYPTQNLKKAQKYLKITQKMHRPESGLYIFMDAHENKHHIQLPICVGVHGFFQHDHDFFRNGYFQAIKFPNMSVEQIKKYSQKEIIGDEETWFTFGWLVALNNPEKDVVVSKDFFNYILVKNNVPITIKESNNDDRNKFTELRKKHVNLISNQPFVRVFYAQTKKNNLKKTENHGKRINRELIKLGNWIIERRKKDKINFFYKSILIRCDELKNKNIFTINDAQLVLKKLKDNNSVNSVKKVLLFYLVFCKLFSKVALKTGNFLIYIGRI
jgi:hypothetical protein